MVSGGGDRYTLLLLSSILTLRPPKRKLRRMAESQPKPAYLIFDVEAVADGELVKNVRYPDEELTPAEAIRKYRDELIEKTGKDVIPPTFVLPVPSWSERWMRRFGCSTSWLSMNPATIRTRSPRSSGRAGGITNGPRL